MDPLLAREQKKSPIPWLFRKCIKGRIEVQCRDDLGCPGCSPAVSPDPLTTSQIESLSGSTGTLWPIFIAFVEGKPLIFICAHAQRVNQEVNNVIP